MKYSDKAVELWNKHCKNNKISVDRVDYLSIHDVLNVIDIALNECKNDWISVYDETPPIHIEILAKSPEGIIHICGWRPAYNIFTVQGKRESTVGWTWKLIN